MEQEQESQELIILDEGAICSCRGLKAIIKAKVKVQVKVKAKAKRKSKSKRTRKRKSTSMCKKVNVQQGRTGDPTH